MDKRNEVQQSGETLVPSSPLMLEKTELDSLNSVAVRRCLATLHEVDEEGGPNNDPFYLAQAHNCGKTTLESDVPQEEHPEPASTTVFKRGRQNVVDVEPPGSNLKRFKGEKEPSPANVRRRVRRETAALVQRATRPEVESKYKQGSTPLETALQSEKLETTLPGYEAKQERVSKPSRNTFSPANLKGVCCGSPSADSVASSSQDCNTTEVAQHPTTPSRDIASLGNIGDVRVRGVLEKMMTGDGFAYKAWDGSINHPVLDSLKRVVVVLVAKLDDEGYRNATKEVFSELENSSAFADFSQTESDHIRGQFPAVNVGISLGPGGTEPMRVSVGCHEPMMQRLLNNEHVQRLASHQDASFKLWQPRLYAHYTNMTAKLRGRHPTLRPNFTRSVFTSMAFNFPPNVCTWRHRDVRNLPYGMCAIHALGSFDPTAGGHLILWELKLIIEFPPGCMVLIPSATITHSNVPVAVGQQRASITQYTAGSLFRHVDNGFTTDTALKNDNKAKFALHSAARLDRWEKGLNMWSKYWNGKII